MGDIGKKQTYETYAEAVEVIESLLRDLKPYVKSFNSVIDQADEAVANPMGYDVVGVAEELEELLDFCETNHEMFQMARPVFFKEAKSKTGLLNRANIKAYIDEVGFKSFGKELIGMKGRVINASGSGLRELEITTALVKKLIGIVANPYDYVTRHFASASSVLAVFENKGKLLVLAINVEIWDEDETVNPDTDHYFIGREIEDSSSGAADKILSGAGKPFVQYQILHALEDLGPTVSKLQLKMINDGVWL